MFERSLIDKKKGRALTTRDKRHGSMSPKLSSAIRLALSRKPTRDTFPAAIPSALMSLGMSLAPVAANAQDTVVSVSPTNASHTAAITTDVSANLSAVETGGLSAQTFVVQGDQTPTGVNTTSGAGSTTVTLNPANDFKPGEQVRATVTGGINTALGGLDPHVWQFRTRVMTGSGTFAQSSNSLGSLASSGIDLGDVDGDGDLDAFVSNFGQGNQVWLNAGSGTFSQSSNSLGDSNSLGVSLGDVDGDGDLDAFVVNFNNQPDRVWLNAGSGTFSLSSNSLGNSNSRAVSLGDVDGDGDLDAFVANAYQANRVWLNAGSGTFTQSSNSLGDSGSFGASLGDVDGDGDLDAFVSNFGQANLVWLNAGSGTFTLSSNSLGDLTSRAASLGDVDGDGDLDAFVANAGANQVWLNAGSGTFTLGAGSLGVSSSYSVSLGDVDGDGDLDAFAGNDNEPNRVWLNAGSGTFTLSSNSLGESSSLGMSLGDVDGDGDLDAFVANYYDQANQVWLNAGDGLDFGDARAPLPTLSGDNGPHHRIVVGAPRLGPTVDSEFDGQPTGNADGDDIGDVDDEDGVSFPNTIAQGQLVADVTIDVQSAPGRLDGWVDFNNDGSFDLAGEQVFTNRSLSIGSHSLAFPVPADAAIGPTTARFRLSTAGGLAPRGAASDGEVEDHLLQLMAPSGRGEFMLSNNSLGASNSLGVSLGDVDGDGDIDAFVANAGANLLWLNAGSGTFSTKQQAWEVRAVLARVWAMWTATAIWTPSWRTLTKANRVWLNAGSGTFTLSSNSLGSSNSLRREPGRCGWRRRSGRLRGEPITKPTACG